MSAIKTTNHIPGPRPKEGNHKTMLYINRAAYAELRKIAVLEGTTIQELINEGMHLRINQYIKEANRRTKKHLEDRRKNWKPGEE